MEIIQSKVINPTSTLEDVALTATLPSEMVDAQVELIGWCAKKISIVATECDELKAAHERAVKMKWKAQPLYNLHRKAVKRLSYYEKVKAALEAGYYIVPNFPIEMFAIRTNQRDPKGYSASFYTTHEQDAKELPIMEGEYKNPFPIRDRQKHTDEQGKSSWENIAENWDDIEFPITMAKPTIMDATNRAMTLKIFDQIGIMPAVRKKEDPVIIGQIKLKSGYTTKLVSFMIAWHLDTSMI